VPYALPTMLRVSAATTIHATPEDVWALYSDMARTTEWVPFVEEVLWTSGPVEVGMVYRERTRLAGVTGVQEWRIVALDPPSRRVEVSRDLGMESTLVISFRRLPEGTRLRQQAVLRSRVPRPLGWLHEALFATVSRRAMALAVRGARRVLEARP
jgi:hypothetical protein